MMFTKTDDPHDQIENAHLIYTSMYTMLRYCRLTFPSSLVVYQTITVLVAGTYIKIIMTTLLPEQEYNNVLCRTFCAYRLH